MLRGFSERHGDVDAGSTRLRVSRQQRDGDGSVRGGASTQFPVRQLSPTQFTLDALNRSNLTYAYEVRVYRKGTPADAAPLVARGTVVNAVN